MTMTKRQTGFTIVELLIVIVVIGILAAITIVAFNGIQSRARDTERATDMSNIKKKLELFHAQNGYYPSSAQVTNATFRQDVLQLPTDTVKPPGATGTISYCWPSAGNTNVYCYVGYRAAGIPENCTADGEQCLAYTLSYRAESDPATLVRINSSVDNR